MKNERARKWDGTWREPQGRNVLGCEDPQQTKLSAEYGV